MSLAVKLAVRDLKKQHRPIDLQRRMVDGVLRYQALCACGRRAIIGSRAETQIDQKGHRRLEVVLGMIRELDGTRRARVALISGLSPERLDELGGVE